jgi:hypothetical protein
MSPACFLPFPSEIGQAGAKDRHANFSRSGPGCVASREFRPTSSVGGRESGNADYRIRIENRNQVLLLEDLRIVTGADPFGLEQ